MLSPTCCYNSYVLVPNVLLWPVCPTSDTVMAYAAMTYAAMACADMARIAIACTVMAYIVMACITTAYIYTRARYNNGPYGYGRSAPHAKSYEAIL